MRICKMNKTCTRTKKCKNKMTVKKQLPWGCGTRICKMNKTCTRTKKCKNKMTKKKCVALWMWYRYMYQWCLHCNMSCGHVSHIQSLYAPQQPTHICDPPVRNESHRYSFTFSVQPFSQMGYLRIDFGFSTESVSPVFSTSEKYTCYKHKQFISVVSNKQPFSKG